MMKNPMDTKIDDAELVVALGPGFFAGKDCHAVIETMRGPNLGKVIWDGYAHKDTGIPGEVGGLTSERLLRSPSNGETCFRYSTWLSSFLRISSFMD